MTELNDEDNPEPAQQAPGWPETAAQELSDPGISAIVAVLDGVADRPVAEHEAIYSDLHDALLQALKEEPGMAREKLEHGTT
ncbi:MULTISPECIES: hypothetical protein [unclassified Arthrobacter]|uniref:hypothetical protein n=1 Tax=unclassified Arthrobacter TaxID=235627 RepID=UPI003391C8BF